MVLTDREVLKRIAALLFALAALADRAGLASLPVRILVFAILRPAETVAQAFVSGMARDHGIKVPQPAGLDGGAPHEATRLALSLRILAMTLAGILALAEWMANCGSGRIVAKIEVQREPALRAECRGQGAPVPDTS